jgi:hypothetical protein
VHNIKLGPGKPSQDTIEKRSYMPACKGAQWEAKVGRWRRQALGDLFYR